MANAENGPGKASVKRWTYTVGDLKNIMHLMLRCADFRGSHDTEDQDGRDTKFFDRLRASARRGEEWQRLADKFWNQCVSAERYEGLSSTSCLLRAVHDDTHCSLYRKLRYPPDFRVSGDALSRKFISNKVDKKGQIAGILETYLQTEAIAAKRAAKQGEKDESANEDEGDAEYVSGHVEAG